tara:strand:- start:169 stop:816 length:648 start_codon:yes stop_codon:yes gene_type:complete
MNKPRKLKHKVLSIQSQKRRKNRFTITFDSGNVFGVSGDVLLSNPLQVDQVLTDEELVDFQNEESLQTIRRQTLNLLSFRMRSSAELTLRLKQKGHNLEQISVILDELKSKGYVNDFEFATLFIKDCVERKKLGRMAVLNQIHRHQIPNEVLDPILDLFYDKNPTDDLISSIILNFMKNRKISFKERERLVGHLKRKGYSWADIEPVVNSLEWKM